MSKSIRTAFTRTLAAAVVSAVSLTVFAAPGTQEVAAGAEPKEVPYLEVLSFEQMTTLAPEARQKYMEGLTELITDLSIMDAGTEYEFFGGSDTNATLGAFGGWRGGYYVLNRAFVDAAIAQQPSQDPAVVRANAIKERIKKQYEAEREAILKDWTPTKVISLRGGQQKIMGGWGIKQYSPTEWNQGRDEALSDLQKRYLKDYSYSLAGEDLKKETPAVKPETLESAKETAKKNAESKPDGGKPETCPSPDVDCKAKHTKAQLKEMAKIRKDKCIYGGNVSSHDGSENQENRKPGRCKRPGPAKFGGLTVECDASDKKNVILCNPVLFDTAEAYKSGATKLKGMCVPATQTVTVDCEIKAKAKWAAEEKAAGSDKSKLPKRFWENEQIPGIADEVNKVARAVNETCGDARVRNYQCRECGTIQRNLAKTNVFAKNCKAVPLPPERPSELGGRPASNGGKTTR